MKKSLILSLLVSALFWGCTTTATPKTPVINTYNTSSNAKNSKSTLTYPGSKEQKELTSKQIPSTQAPAKIPMEETAAISSAPVAVTPMPEIVEEIPLASQEVTSQPTYQLPEMALSHGGQMIKIAVLIPQKTIKKYAVTSVNSVMSYLLYRNYSFDMNVFNSNDEREESIVKALADIKAGGYHFIIAPVTPQGATILANKVTDTVIFIPTIHRSSVPSAGANIVFGGIDYEQQMALLAPYANERVGTFEDGSGLSLQLGTLAKKNSTRVFYEKRIESSKANFKQLFKGNNSLNNASFYLNTPLVTSSLIASQLRANDIAPYALLSTQINYNPLLLTLTQSEDRDKMFIANSIQKTPAKLEEINALFGHDIVYDWVNYSTSVGADLLATHFFENKTERVFKESISNNQVVYNTVIVKPAQHSFKPISQ